MKKGILKGLSTILSTAMVSTLIVVPNVKAAEVPTPVVSYNFESEPTGLTLAGEAKVTQLENNGVLQMATKATNGSTYAKFADDAFANADFSAGLTLTAKVYPTGWESDWTPMFMFGSGQLGQDGPGDASLQFTQGWSARVSSKGAFDGYFGNEVAAPYAWDYFSQEANRNQWYTVALTLTPTELATYINGVKVQSCNAGNQDTDQAFKEFLQDFKTMKGNYLGASYWPADADFQGYLDNVAIFNTALTADQIAAVDTVFSATPDATNPPADDTQNQTPDATNPPAGDTQNQAPDATNPPADDNQNQAPDTTNPPADDTQEPDTTEPADANEDNEPEETEPTLSKKKLTVKVGKSKTLKVNDAEGTVKWSSNKKKVAKVNKNGKVTGVKAGKATITAKVDGKTLKCKVTVKK